MKFKLTLTLLLCLYLPNTFAASFHVHKPKKKSTPAVKVVTEQKTQKNSTSPAKTPELITKIIRLKDRFAKMTQNFDNPRPKKYWLNHLSASGLINVEAYNYQNDNFKGKHKSRIALATAKLNLDAKLNDWVSGHVGLFYSTTKNRYYPIATTKSGIELDEVYATIANFKNNPFYFRAGKQYLPFGRYHHYPIIEPLTQTLSEMRATALQLGFVGTNGFYGAAYTLNGSTKYFHSRHKTMNNYGITLGYDNKHNATWYDIGIDYLNNMADVGAIEANLPNSDKYVKRVGGLGGYADIITGPFDFNIRYVTALTKFAPQDFRFQKHINDTKGAKPSSSMIVAGYTFKTRGKYNSKINIGYQWSDEAYNINPIPQALRLPKARLSVEYGIELIKNTILAFEYDRDHDYSSSNGGTHRYNDRLTVRFTVLVP